MSLAILGKIILHKNNIEKKTFFAKAFNCGTPEASHYRGVRQPPRWQAKSPTLEFP